MAPKAGKAKPHKSKGEKKKKEDKVLPVVVDITVEKPDFSHLTLKGISTDRILDVRKLLAVHVETCHLTCYSISHVVRGPQLKDTVEIVTLKPCHVTIAQEDYTEELAVAHIRRLLDIVACTTAFGPPQAKSAGGYTSPASNSPKASPKSGGNESQESDAFRDYTSNSNAKCQRGSNKPGWLETSGTFSSSNQKEEGGVIYPPPKLGQFYDFFSFSNLTPPLQYIRRSVRPFADKTVDDFFQFDVRVCSGKLMTIVACLKGFYPAGKRTLISHSLVGLLLQISRAFDGAYRSLMKAFLEHNKFGNLPYAFRANTWVVPPIAADSPAIFPVLPTEDETWGGSGGGQGKEGTQYHRKWAREFSILASMACKTPEDRQIRDRKAFLLHSLFVDVAVLKAVEAIKNIIFTHKNADGTLNKIDAILHKEQVGDLSITVRRDAFDASSKLAVKYGNQIHGLCYEDVSQKNLLKGIASDESVIVHDTAALGVVIVRHCGYIAIVKVPVESDPTTQQDFEIDDQPEGGSNALNVNSMRLLLHKPSGQVGILHHLNVNGNAQSSRTLVRKLLALSLAKLEEEDPNMHKKSIRWELGACWVQHLQQDPGKSQPNKCEEMKVKPLVKGLGKQLKEIRRKSDERDEKMDLAKDSFTDASKHQMSDDCGQQVKEMILMKFLPETAFLRLKESNTGLHVKSPKELIEMALKYYEDSALPKLVADFGSLELSPVDGRTLTDFMHTRGLQMCSLGRVVALADKLPHIRFLCIHEMVVRAFKHILHAVVAAVNDLDDLASSIASCLNLFLGSLPPENVDPSLASDDRLKRNWLENFLYKRFGWSWKYESFKDLRKLAILRGLCYKVGLELAPRDYDMDAPEPFRKSDIISMVPVYKHAVCSSADGRTLLESSKTSLDKGKLEDAVNFGTKALAKLVAVCGPYHRMTAGAYSLLAVVLYHTGDFNQATIYQQKALDINERELGFDHPDTMKTYGDLAVFYYRLQHTELALKYVNRALYLLHLICGPSHPNTAATYINVAMMEEGLGNVHVALRYLHEALKCNQRLLGADHIQTAASYHAIAIALSLMEAYSLSVHHEKTTLRILKAKLGTDDLRTQDAAAWLEYFESKVQEQLEATRNGTPKPDVSIASKGHLSVSDLLEFINPDEELKIREIQKKQARTKVKYRIGQIQWEPSEDEELEKTLVDYSSIEVYSDKENTTHTLPREDKDEMSNISLVNITSSSKDDIEVDKTDDGWQEAVPKGRYFSSRKPSSSRRPSLARLNTNSLFNGENSRGKGLAQSDISSPRTLSGQPSSSTNPSSPISEKTAKSLRIVVKPVTAAMVSKAVPSKNSLSIQPTRKNLSYKEAALASPGTVMKYLEQPSLVKDFNEQNDESCKEATNAVEENTCKEATNAVEENTCKEATNAIVENTCKEATNAVEENTCKEATNAVEKNTCKEATNAVEENTCKETINTVEFNTCKEVTNAFEENTCKEVTNAVVENTCKEATNDVKENTCKEATNAVEENTCKEATNTVEVNTCKEATNAFEENTCKEAINAVGKNTFKEAKNAMKGSISITALEAKEDKIYEKDAHEKSVSRTSKIEVSETMGNGMDNFGDDHKFLEESEVPLQNNDILENNNLCPLAVLGKNAATSTEDAPHEEDDNYDMSSGGENEKVSSIEGEKKQEASDTSKKLSASAPPFNPTTMPVFGSVTIPVINQNGGILPPPVIMPPILTINPIHKHFHQSATARIPYGPRLAGGYNRAGHRFAKNKLGLQNIEPVSPKIMNPDAAEFIPGQPWLPNGYPTSVIGFPSALNGFTLTLQETLDSPDSIATSPNSVVTLPFSVVESPDSAATSPTISAGVFNKTETLADGNVNIDHVFLKDIVKPEEEGKANTEAETEINEEETDTVPEDKTLEIESSELPNVEKSAKCWADYSDGEAEDV